MKEPYQSNCVSEFVGCEISELLSIIIPARNNAELTANCLSTTLYSFRRLGQSCEFLLIDDDSPPEEQILDVFHRHRAQAAGWPVRIIRSRKRQHYSGVFSIGLHHASGDPVFFISNDMVVTPSFLAAQLAVAGKSDRFGIVRGTSNYTDTHPEHKVDPDAPPRSYQDVETFSRKVFERYGETYTEDVILSGDAILLRRALIQHIGVLDLNFFGYFGDIDYGLRAQAAGFKLVCAKGAWLYHFGSGHMKREMVLEKATEEQVWSRRMALVEAGYQQFRKKWQVDEPKSWRYGPGTTPRSLIESARRNASGVQICCEFPRAVMQELEFH